MRKIVIGLLAVAVLALGTAVWIMWSDLRNLRDSRTAGIEAMAAAKAMAPDLLSYNYRTIQQDLARAREHTTGPLAKHYQELASTLVTTATAQKTVQTAAVAGAAVERAVPGRVEVLLFVNMGTIKEPPGATAPQQQISKNRARFVMIKQDSRWLVEDLSTLLGAA
ncbi:hypothetical protein OIE66_36170 [Nonomuraea sp. NBC_01738]|uniref:hypothetical protein n=1 Tax=Nonomuraea sp. NBC_01738 TaxID=2976003 RepID=UPI002E0DD42C|nr:hypothetical protein OIE66_36170 [Nonomuraea sp. NBC_01738]